MIKYLCFIIETRIPGESRRAATIDGFQAVISARGLTRHVTGILKLGIRISNDPYIRPYDGGRAWMSSAAAQICRRWSGEAPNPSNVVGDSHHIL